MNSKLFVTVIILALMPLLAFTQSAAPVVSSYTIKGVLLDSLTLDGEPYATIRIFKKEDPSKPVKMAVTDTNGKFQEKLSVSTGDYMLTISSIGKNTVTKEFKIDPGTKTLDLGTLYTQDATEELAGVEVVAQRPLVKVDMDKIEYNIEDDPDSKSNSVLEMLRKVPLVTVDGEDNIQVNGSSSFKIHVNGKPNNMMSNNPKDVLKSMPANTIKYIEVITEPGAKYDAEGVGGILNIVTVGGGMEGYTATFNGSVNNRGIGGGVYATVQVGKFTVTGNYSYNRHKEPTNHSESLRENLETDKERFLRNTASNKFDGNFQYGYLEGSYEIDTLRLITFSANMYGNNFDIVGDGKAVMTDINEDFIYSYKSFNNNNQQQRYIGASADYQRSFKKKGELFTFSYRLNNNPQNSEARVDYDSIIKYPHDLLDLYSKNKAHTIEHTFQTDYVNPITSKHEIEAGLKYIIRNSRSDSKYFYPDDSGNFVENVDRRNEYDHLQDIVAAYAGYRLKLGKFGLRTGLRYEHTFMEVKYADDKNQSFDSNFDDLVPSLNLSYQLADMKTLRASYNMRISRPGIWYLNPYVDRTNPDRISYGNPDLDSEKSHSFGLNFNTFSQKINFDIGLRHTFVNNSIERYAFVGKDEETGNNNVEQSTYRNMGKSSNTRLSTYFNWNIGPKTRFYLNGNVSYVDFKSDDKDLANSGFGFYCHGGLQHTLPWNLRLSLNGGGSGPRISPQRENSGYYYYSLGVNKQFLKDRLTLSINTSNIFQEYRSFTSTVNTSKLYSRSKNKYPGRYFGFNISYRIGELKAAVKKTARSIQNDDVKSGGEGGGSGSGQS